MPPSTISPPPSKRRRISTHESQNTAITLLTLAPSLPSRPITLLQPHLLQQQNHLRTCLRRWKWPHVVCLQEVKISRLDTKTQQAVQRAVRAPRSTFTSEPGYTAHFSLPRDKFNARGFRGRVYGVCTLVRDDILPSGGGESVVRETPWDLEGRVLVLELPARNLAVFNVYAVNGTGNPYRSPVTGEVVGTRHDRKRAFHSDLKRECESYEARGWDVVVAGDLNIARGPEDGFPGRRMGEEHVLSRRDFEEKFMVGGKRGGLGMVDGFRALHGGERKYSYRGRGREWGSSCDRVDLVLVSRGLWGKGGLVEADLLDEEGERGPSDHVPVYVTVAVGGDGKKEVGD